MSPRSHAHRPDDARRTLAYLDHSLALLADHAANAPELVNHLAHQRELAQQEDLEPALDGLERLGDRYACPRGYWLCLRQAAANMRLPGRLAGFDRRLARGRSPGTTARRRPGSEEAP